MAIQDLKPRKKGDPKVPGSGKKKGYKAINTYVREILQKKPIKEMIADFESLNIPFKNNAELLAWKKMLIALHENPQAALSAIKDIEERQDGKVALDINVKELTLEELNE